MQFNRVNNQERLQSIGQWLQHAIPRALGCGTYLSVWWEVGALCVEHLVVSTDSVRATKLFTYVIDNNDYQ